MQTQKPDNLKTLDNYWIYGPTGTGKSMSTRERFPSFYKKNGSSEWFTGYHGEDTVLWEEFSPYQIKYTELLKELADHYPLQVKVHGFLAYLRPRRVVITSNYHPAQIWNDPESLEPILRRFKVHKLTHDKYDMHPEAPQPRPILA